MPPIQKIGIRNEVMGIARELRETKRRWGHRRVETVTDIDRDFLKCNVRVSGNQSPQGIRDGTPSVSKFEIGLFVREAEQKTPLVFCRCVTPPHHRGEL